MTMANTIRGLLPDGTLPSAALAQVQGMVDDLDIPEPAVQGVPIFATLAEAQAWEAENPGKIALTLEEPAAPDVEVSAPAPVFNDDADTYTIPTATGVRYLVDGSVVVGTVEVGDVDVSVTVTAEALDGYVLTGTSEWTHEFTATPASPGLAPEDVGSLLASWDMGAAVSSSGVISEVPDSVGGKALVASTAGPTLISSGGKAFAKFTASSNTRLRWLGAWGHTGDYTICAIIKRGAVSGAAISALGNTVNVTGTGIFASSVTVGADVIVVGADDLVLATAAYSAEGVTFRVGAARQTGAGAVAGLADHLALGALYSGAGSQFVDSTIGRVWVHGKAITQADHDALTEWARAEWGTL